MIWQDSDKEEGHNARREAAIVMALLYFYKADGRNIGEDGRGLSGIAGKGE